MVATTVGAWMLMLVVAGGIGGSDVKETVRLTISGESLAGDLIVEDRALLDQSNVYRGSFIGAPAADGDPRWPRYRVAFDVQTLDGTKRDAYVVYLAVDPATRNGLVYLPGEGDAEYRANISTILRTGRDGAWHHATPAWARALESIVR